MIILPLLYLVLSEAINFLDKNSLSLHFAVKGLQLEKKLFEALNFNGIYLIPVSRKELGYSHYFLYEKKEYILQFYYVKGFLTESTITQFRDQFLNGSKKMLIVTNAEITLKAPLI
jgi:hypothetical protein